MLYLELRVEYPPEVESHLLVILEIEVLVGEDASSRHDLWLTAPGIWRIFHTLEDAGRAGRRGGGGGRADAEDAGKEAGR